MNMKKTMHQTLTLIILSLLVLTIFSISTATAATIDLGDCTFKDTFSNSEYIDITDNLLKTGTTYTLSQEPYRTFDFSNAPKKQAYSFKTILFSKYFDLEPDNTLLSRLFIKEFSILNTYKLKTLNEVYYETSSLFFKNKLGHHFRIQLDVEPSSIGQLQLNYYGKIDLSAGNRSTLDLAFYYYSDDDGQWKPFTQSYNAISEDPFTYEKNITSYISDIFDDNNYIDILVYANMPYQGCWLQTDYIEITATNVDAYTDDEGVLIGEPITPTDFLDDQQKYLYYWDVFSWEDSTRSEAYINYSLWYINEENETERIPDSDLPGNSEGFTNSPVSLSTLKDKKQYQSIIPKAIFSTDTPSYSPQLKSWTLTWQSPPTQWSDQFNFTSRIDTSNKIQNEGGDISITPIQGDWPQQHATSNNNRQIDVAGPKVSTLNWIYEQSRYEYKNPVIKDGFIYVNVYDSSDEQSYLQRYKILALTDETFYVDDVVSYEVEQYLENSPAISVDGQVVIATGDYGSTSNTNYLYCLDKNLNLVWESDPFANTCFFSSPVIYDNKIYVSSWNGDLSTESDESNQLYVLDLSTGAQIANISLPSGSYSTPAVTNEYILVCCDSSNDNSIYAINQEDYSVQWNKTLGAIGYSSPVVDDENVYAIHKSKNLIGTQLTALTLSNGTQLWQISLNEGISSVKTIADATPALYEDVLFVPTPSGNLKAINTTDGETRWTNELEDYSLSTQSLTLSASYADGLVYITTNSGQIAAIYASSGTTKWTTTADYYDETVPAFATSPIISNGLIFAADEAGRLYSFGSYQEPTQGITGSLTSIPITRPQGTWWGNFNANYTNNENSNITFSILDEDTTEIRSISNGDAINTLDVDTIILKADLSASNTSNNPTLHSWGVSFSTDNNAPTFYADTLQPTGKNPIWSNEVIPEFSIEVQDNNSGLVTNEATYTIWCSIDYGQIQAKGPFFANLTGDIGTTLKQELNINLSERSFFSQITSITKVNITVEDRAGLSSTYTITINQDTGKPISTLKTDELTESYNQSLLTLIGTVEDPVLENEKSSGIDHVDLYFKHSSTETYTGEWQYFGENDNDIATEDPEWQFRPQDGGGYYLLCTIATDIIGNVEDFPNTTDDLPSILFDNDPPVLPAFDNPYWYNDLPTIALTFTDDYKLSNISYKTEMTTAWTTIATTVDSATYTTQWTIGNDDWISLNEGSLTNINFKLEDTLGNIRIVTGGESLRLGKDTLPPQSALTIPNLDSEYTWKEEFLIAADSIDILAGSQSSGVDSVTLYYRFDESKDGLEDQDWIQYNETLTQVPYEWSFTASEGNGYYDFKVETTDFAGNLAESEVFQTGVNVLPTVYLAAIIALVVILILVSLAIVIFWNPKKKPRK